MEIWKDVVGYEGYYKVSSIGRVKSLDRVTKTGRYGPYKKKGKILITPVAKNGYVSATLMVGTEKKKKFLVHRLVAEAFFGNPKGRVVDHLDGDRSNNKVDNLEYVSMRENILRGNTGVSNGDKKCKSRGVTISQWNRYVASIRIKGKGIYLGSFDTEEEAAAAYLEAFERVESEDK